MKLLLNAIRCKSCDQVIVSTHRHDFKSCKCGKVSVDGGLEYTRRAGHLDLIEERCAYVWDKYSQATDAADKFIVWSPGGKTNPTVCFDSRWDAEQSAKELAEKVPPSDWYVAQLSHVSR